MAPFRIGILCFLLLSCNITGSPKGESSSDILKVTFLNVGQGNASLLQYRGKSMLMDAGPDSLGILDTLRARGIDTLDWVVVSHGHRDHCGGLWELLGHIPIRQIYLSPDRGNPWTLDSVRTLALQFRVPFDTLVRGDVLTGLEPWSTRVLWPEGGHRWAENASSLVLWVGDEQGSILWTGDLGFEQESLLQKLEPTLHASVLQVGHHGSATSTGIAFTGQINPDLAVICVGQNPWGHPRTETLQRLELILGDSSRIYRTDRDGSVTLQLSGNFGIVHPLPTHGAQGKP